jgi:cytochrome c oxidase assembly protein subunit 11
MSGHATLNRQQRARVRTALAAAAVAAGMVGLSFAAVPIYRIFCQVTGFDGTTQRADAVPAALARRAAGRTIKIRFDGNVRGLPWQFHPVENRAEVKLGVQNLAYFRAANPSVQRTTGQASYNVSPDAAGKYFVKIQCFCFSEQTLAPGQQVDMPVVYYVDPAILDDPDARDIDEITLSYSFFPIAPSKPEGIRATGANVVAARISG